MNLSSSPLVLALVGMVAFLVPLGVLRQARRSQAETAGMSEPASAGMRQAQAIGAGVLLGSLVVIGITSASADDGRRTIVESSPPTADAAAVAAGTASAHSHADDGGPGPLSDSPDDPRAEFGPDAPMTTAERIRLGEELAGARQAAMEFPTVRDAKAAGMVTPGLEPGFGAHFQFPTYAALQSIRPDGTVDPSNPGAWIYEGVDDDDPVVGVMYNYLGPDAPIGFTGPNDHWHRHPNACLHITDEAITLPFGDQSVVTKEECDSVQGMYMERSNWMVHAWVVPGWESPDGVFAHENPELLSR